MTCAGGRAFGNPLAFGSPDPYLAHRIGSLGAYNSPLYPGSVLLHFAKGAKTETKMEGLLVLMAA